MSRLTVAGMAVLGTLAVALILGTQYLKGDTESTSVVTVLGLLGLGISQLIGHKEAADAKETAEELSKDLRNGTFERLLRESLTKLANEDGFPLELHSRNQEKEGGDNGR